MSDHDERSKCARCGVVHWDGAGHQCYGADKRRGSQRWIHVFAVVAVNRIMSDGPGAIRFQRSPEFEAPSEDEAYRLGWKLHTIKDHQPGELVNDFVVEVAPPNLRAIQREAMIRGAM